MAALAHGSEPYRLIARAADVGFVTPRDPGQARDIVAEVRAAQDASGRANDTIHVFADLVVFLGPGRRSRGRAQEQAGRAGRPGIPKRCARLHRDARPARRSAAGVAAGRAVGVPAAPGRHSGRPGGHHPGAGARTAAPRRVPHPATRPARCAGGSASAAPPAVTPTPGGAQHDQATEADPPRRPLPRREQHDRVERPGVRQPHRVQLVRAPGPDRRTGQVRLPVPGRGAAAARAERQDLRPGRGGAAGHVHRAGRAGCGDRPARAWPARSIPPSTSRTRWPGSSPAWITCPAAGRRGTSSRPGTRSPGRTSGAAASCRRRTRYERARTFLQHGLGAVRLLARRRDRRRQGVRGVPGRRRTQASSRTPTRTSTSTASSTCPAARRAGRSSSRPGTPRRAASSPPPARTRSSAGTARWRTGRRSTPT